MRNYLKVSVIIYFLLVNSQAFSGWSANGGELIKDSSNPWFIQNTTDVSYCIIRGENFSLDEDKADRQIRQAIHFWKLHFAKINGNSTSGISIKIATQNFTRTSCANDVDLVFQLGVLLDDEQNSFIRKPTRLVAAAVRTSYDEVNLRGKGFIYISPDSGPNRFESMIENQVWSFHLSGKLFFFVLAHEMGHLFGLSHWDMMFPKNSYPHVMDSDFPESIVSNPKIAANFEYLDPKFGHDLSDEIRIGMLQRRDSAAVEFFHIPEIDAFIRFRYNENGFVVEGSRINSSHEYFTHPIGYVTFSRDKKPTIEEHPIVYVVYTEKQKVFDLNDGNAFFFRNRFLTGPGILTKTYRGSYISFDSAITRPIWMEFSPNRVKIGGILNDEIIFDMMNEKQ